MMSQEWAEKYRPKRLSEVVGNPAAINDLREWAESWERGTPKKKAVVLVGDAGIGKTSSALALAEEFGWGVVELNASDLRNADSIKKIATSGALNETFTDSGEFVSTRHGGRKLIILDEADNIFGKEDYGGIQAISMTIRETQQPIILIVNDYYALTKRSSAIKNMCKKIKFSKIKKTSVIKVLRNICQNEDISISTEALYTLAEHSAGDLRSALNDLQSLSLGKKKISEKDVTVLGYRDSSINIFKALQGIFRATSYQSAKESAINLNEAPDYLLLWIDENLPSEYKKPEDLANAYIPLSKASIYLGRVRRRQHYRFWSYANDLMTAGVALSKTSSYYGYSKYQFPRWLTKMSRSKGTRSIQKSINDKLSTYCHTSRYVAQVEIFPYYKYLFNKDDTFNINQIADLEFDAEEIGFLLGENSDSALVKQLIDESKNKEADKKEEKSKSLVKEHGKEPDKKPEEIPDSEEPEDTKGLELRQRNLTDF
jgi:replication factor C large subunit